MVHDQDVRVTVNTTTRQEEDRQRTIVYWPHGAVREAVRVGGHLSANSAHVLSAVLLFTR